MPRASVLVDMTKIVILVPVSANIERVELVNGHKFDGSTDVTEFWFFWTSKSHNIARFTVIGI